MRVATTFTGVAACALAFAQPAIAAAGQTGLHQAPVKDSAAVHPMNSMSASAGQCTAARQHWVHVRNYSNNYTCFGNKGTFNLEGPIVLGGYCPGNNYGWIHFTNAAQNKSKDQHFTQGTTYHSPPPGYPDLWDVHISGWKNHDKC